MHALGSQSLLVDRKGIAMNRRLRLPAYLFLLVAACSTSSTEPPPISRSQAISVLPPNNQTGSPLFVSSPSSSDRFGFDAQPTTVGDLLAREARKQLAERGFRVTSAEQVKAAAEGHVPRTPHAAAEIAAHGKLDGLALYMEIIQWEPDDPAHTRHVIVGLSASLVDTPTRNVVWDFYRQPESVATPGESTLKDAYETAARMVIAQVLEGFRP
jgi:hypothetical protein